MRVELDKQLLLKALLTHLTIIPSVGSGKARSDAHMVPFPAYGSPTSKHDPKYELRPEEERKTRLELLQLALLRVVMDLEVEDPDAADYPLCHFSRSKAIL